MTREDAFTESEAPALGERRQLLTGEREYETAIDRVIEAAETRLHIFDVDLVRGDYSSAGRYELLLAFLRKHPKNTLVIVLHDVSYMTSRCPRLMNLLRSFSHAVSVYQVDDAGRVANDPFVIADELHFVHRLHRHHPRSVLALHDANSARALEGRFQELLEVSYPAVFATTLGL